MHLQRAQLPKRESRRRPCLKLEPTDHPLPIERRDGITLDRLEIYAMHVHDLRPALPSA